MLFSQNLVASFNRGDQKAQSSFYNAYYDRVLLEVLKSVSNPDDTNDIGNDVFTRFFQLKLAFSTVRNMERYLFSMVRTMCRDFNARQKTPVIKMDQAAAYYLDIEDRANQLAQTKLTARILHAWAMEILPPQCREVYRLHYIRDMQIPEIAKILGISVRTVETHLYDARRHLKREVKNDPGLKNMIRLLLPILWSQLNS